jgi:DNA-binding LytR/AlgR family response regulator
MTCIIIDDEATARAVISQLCSKSRELDVIEEFDNPIEAIKFLSQQNIDIVFLDIHMPGFSGIDFVQTLKNPPKIVLTTSDTSFAVDAYEYEAIVDYLVKPVTQDRFEKTIEKVKSMALRPAPNLNREEDRVSGQDLYINIDRRLIKLKLNEIIIIEANGDYIDIKTDQEKYHVRTTLKKIKDKLPENIFLQIHRSYIINFSKIIDIQDNSVLIGKSVIPISRSNRPELMRRLNVL